MPKLHRAKGPALAPRDVIADRYELVRELARGGMGTVWVATDAKLGRQVALKIMVAGNTEDAHERFEREARTVAQLRSSHVVEVHDYGVDHGVPFIAMELLEGESLGDRIKRQGQLSLAETAEILVQVAKGLKAAHGAGLVHRDLKPSNIFLAHRDDGEVVKLLDFGVVKAIDRKFGSESTASGVVLGTPQYMSPEQARGIKEIDHRADLWSLGVILLRMLTGTNPFGSDSVGDAVIKICIEPIPRASDYQGVPGELDLFFERALARDPERRFQTAVDLARDFLGRVGLSSRELRGERSSRLDLVSPEQFSAIDTGRHAALQASLDEKSVELTPPPLPAPRAALASGVQPVGPSSAATIEGTQVTRSVSIRLPVHSRRPWIVAGGALAAVLGGAIAYSLLGGDDPAAPARAATAAGLASGAAAQPSATGESNPAGLPASTAAAPVAADGGSPEAPDAAGTPGGKSGEPPPTKTARPGGQWVPPGRTTPGKTPRWY